MLLFRALCYNRSLAWARDRRRERRRSPVLCRCRALHRASVAQLVERLIRNQQVGGSIPLAGSPLLLIIKEIQISASNASAALCPNLCPRPEVFGLLRRALCVEARGCNPVPPGQRHRVSALRRPTARSLSRARHGPKRKVQAAGRGAGPTITPRGRRRQKRRLMMEKDESISLSSRMIVNSLSVETTSMTLIPSMARALRTWL